MGALGISCPENSLLCYTRSNAEFEGHMTQKSKCMKMVWDSLLFPFIKIKYHKMSKNEPSLRFVWECLCTVFKLHSKWTKPNSNTGTFWMHFSPFFLRILEVNILVLLESSNRYTIRDEIEKEPEIHVKICFKRTKKEKRSLKKSCEEKCQKKSTIEIGTILYVFTKYFWKH